MRIVNALLRSPIISGLCAVGAMYATAVGDVSITQTGGTMFVLENQIIDQERQITLWCQGSPGMSVTITATSGSNPIRYIHVASEAFTGTTGNVVLTVNESGGTIPRIGEIYPVSAAPFEDGELWIGDVLISGGIGDPSSPHSRVIFCRRDFTCAGGGYHHCGSRGRSAIVRRRLDHRARSVPATAPSSVTSTRPAAVSTRSTPTSTSAP